ncbi:lysocardiolipin acyltransferase 1 isoform X2 [Procambarus clarkii]|uniref:lysocardiolipin acyltransferase 1 isoform X2 n=1 Tax=Procambarus clarkii TaxID=6728 RepID=UPI001E672CA9|nr:lysocardiolipin acyltransferase 1-like [Procambarus clarkii]
MAMGAEDVNNEGACNEATTKTTATKLKRPTSLDVGGEDTVKQPPAWHGWVKGITFVLLWYGSILMGFFSLYCPALALLFVSRPTYRRTTEVIFTMWESYAVALMEVVYGVRFFLSGDVIRPGETSIIILNHRNRLDWNFFWGALAHATSPPAHNCKIVLKSGIRKFPGLGWVMQMSCFLYIRRRWEDDQRLMNNVLDYFRDIDHTFQVLLFPEGTNLTPETQKKSEEYARKAGLPCLTHVLHPRTTGFTYLVNKLRNSKQLNAVYDVTVAYPKTLPLTELDLAKGLMPEEVHFHIKRYQARSLPQTEEGLRIWLGGVWEEKDKLLQTTLQQGYFPASTADSPHPPMNASYLAFLFWTPLTIGMVYLLCTWWVMQLWCLAHTILFTVVSFATDGLQHFEIWLHRQEAARLGKHR